MRKSLLIYILFLLTTLTVSAQQDAQFTQFMVYKLGYNPAYAGLDRAPTFTGLVRNQWLGFEGAPQSQLLSFNMPFGSSQRIGLGFTARRHTIG
ncbi:MAG: type IX secretion system membrane protein PorP/SprF, partial [Bacteroidota bacterium]